MLAPGLRVWKKEQGLEELDQQRSRQTSQLRTQHTFLSPLRIGETRVRPKSSLSPIVHTAVTTQRPGMPENKKDFLLSFFVLCIFICRVAI